MPTILLAMFITPHLEGEAQEVEITNEAVSG